MKSINYPHIVAHSEAIDNMSDAQVESLVEQFSREQPAVVAYLLGIYGDEFAEEDREWLFILGLKIWHIINQEYTKLPEINEIQIDSADEANDEMLNYLAEESDEGFAHFAEILLNEHPQRDLIEFALLSTVDEDIEEETDLEEDMRGLMFIALKTIIDVFDKNLA
ncbi:MAG: hypothetical protein MUE85_17820 [Microscillaceae bacterium]|jgi:hypothetical protein|nr:hypothetical protein [Microscillaceae bacterium]